MKQSQSTVLKIGKYTFLIDSDNILRLLKGDTGEPPGFTIRVYEQLYTMAQDINQGTKIFHDFLQKILKDYFSSEVLPRLRKEEGKRMLEEFVHTWLRNKRVTLRLTRRSNLSFLQCLERVSVKAFKDSIYLEVRDRVRDCVISMINAEREGKNVDRFVLTNAVKIFMEIGGGEEDSGEHDYYKEDFEKHMIEETEVYYSNKAPIWIQECSYHEYMTKAKHCLEHEKRILSQYLCSSSLEELLQRVQHELLIVHQKPLLEKEGSGLKSLLAAGSFGDLSRMFEIYDKIPGSLKGVATVFRDSAIEEGIAVLQEAGVMEEQVLVSRLIELHDRFSSYVRDCFNSHDLFLKALKDAFEMLCNRTSEGTSIAEIFTAFFSATLMKFIDEDTEQTLGKAVKFFVYMKERDLISIFNGKKFVQRLLYFGQNPNNVLTRLKQHSGNQLRSLAEAMLADLISAKQNRDSFRGFLTHNQSLDPGFDFSVTVLTTGIWPRYKAFDIKFPVEMEESLQSFKRFYEKITNRRKLRWVESLGLCQLLGRFDERPIELIVTTHQAAVLLLFNSSDRLSFSNIALLLNLFPDVLIGLLHSLCLDKYKILTKKPETETISQSDVFEFNTKFVDATRKIHVPPPAMAREGKKPAEEEKGDRNYAIEAAIVRTMKRRKVLKLEELVSECVDQLRQSFKPNIKTIKNRVEALIKREFLERDPLDQSTFRYLP